MEQEEKNEGDANLKKAVGLTNYMFSLPSATVLLSAMVIVALLFGLVVNFPPKENFIFAIFSDAFFLLLAPALLTVLIVKLLIRKLELKRIAATALVGETIYALVYIISMFTLEKNLFYGQLIIFIGSAFVFLIWYLVARLIFILKYRSILFAVIQLFLYMFFLFEFKAAQYFMNEPLLNLVTKAYIASFVLLVSVYLIFMVINAPMKKTFGYSSTDVFTFFVSQWVYKKNDLEEAFEKIGETARTLVGVVSFRRNKDTIFFIVPCIHFGPFGNLGGSEFSYLIAQEIKKNYNSEAFVFHGPVTHDLNPTSSKELEKITNAIKRIVTRAEYRPSSVSFSLGKEGECQAEALVFDNDGFIGVTRAPRLTEDINFGLGLSMMYAAEKKLETAIIADQHNAELGEVTSFEPGSEIGYRYIKAVEDAVAKKTKKQKLKIGIAIKASKASSIGKAGIKIAALSSEPMYVIVLIDSNGITPQFKERIEQKILEKYKCKPSIFTTDTHETNTVRGVFNPIKDEETILEEIVAGVGEAIEDMQDAKVYVGKEWFDIRTIGAKHSIEIVSTINSIVAITKIITPLIILAAILIIFILISML